MQAGRERERMERFGGRVSVFEVKRVVSVTLVLGVVAVNAYILLTRDSGAGVEVRGTDTSAVTSTGKP